MTWEVCPSCGRTAAVGWTSTELIEFDCTAGCRLTDKQVREFTERRRPAVKWLTLP